MSGSPRYIQYRGDPPPCDRTHRTPPRLPFGQTTLLSTHALDLPRLPAGPLAPSWPTVHGGHWAIGPPFSPSFDPWAPRML
ncbi:hypothetical protein DTW94_02350 [Streptomyces cavourensis]|uniref:Uncharacterized protein n=1 Tax=Streptomyces cavourensis TaxID=67258 RepID=A0AAD0Q0Y8_9ACTN|nr:hypothetical protein DTW94_02350 [Streptomyces cavourensis]